MTEQSKAQRPQVLGIPVDAVDYESSLAHCLTYLDSEKPIAVTAANTHLIALARHDASFADVMKSFDLVLPDGMPLVWALRRQGIALDDRVYGPYFMRHVLRQAPVSCRHFFFGGTNKTLKALRGAITELRPEIQIAGMVSPPFRTWSDDDLAEFATAINSAKPDFVWICLGGEKQERWLIENLHRFPRGVFVCVGDAFALLAGERPFAPAWMQRNGLTWLYRFAQDPTRLWSRYIKFNSMFVWYSLRDSIYSSELKSPPKLS